MLPIALIGAYNQFGMAFSRFFDPPIMYIIDKENIMAPASVPIVTALKGPGNLTNVHITPPIY